MYTYSFISVEETQLPVKLMSWHVLVRISREKMSWARVPSRHPWAHVQSRHLWVNKLTHYKETEGTQKLISTCDMTDIVFKAA